MKPAIVQKLKPITPKQKGYFSPKQMAELAGISPAQLRRLSVAKKVPGARRRNPYDQRSHFRYHDCLENRKWLNRVHAEMAARKFRGKIGIEHAREVKAAKKAQQEDLNEAPAYSRYVEMPDFKFWVLRASKHIGLFDQNQVQQMLHDLQPAVDFANLLRDLKFTPD
jgi:phage terminase Nu1 subunit (DNA packaging protein)